VEGIIRSILLDTGKVLKGVISTQDLPSVTAIALSNSLIGVLPCNKIIDQDGRIIWRSTSDVLLSLDDNMMS
jgi:branched-subunit amino acid aminotransferase/4-amino-4-deoxychorismate lyase